jgi:hypothetical protein
MSKPPNFSQTLQARTAHGYPTVCCIAILAAFRKHRPAVAELREPIHLRAAFGA